MSSPNEFFVHSSELVECKDENEQSTVNLTWVAVLALYSLLIIFKSIVKSVYKAKKSFLHIHCHSDMASIVFKIKSATYNYRPFSLVWFHIPRYSFTQGPCNNECTEGATTTLNRENTGKTKLSRWAKFSYHRTCCAVNSRQLVECASSFSSKLLALKMNKWTYFFSKAGTVTNPAIWLVLSAVRIFLSLTTVTVTLAWVFFLWLFFSFESLEKNK